MPVPTSYLVMVGVDEGRYQAGMGQVNAGVDMADFIAQYDPDLRAGLMRAVDVDSGRTLSLEELDEMLMIDGPAPAGYGLCLDRQARPVLLAVHRNDERPLAMLHGQGVLQFEQALHAQVGSVQEHGLLAEGDPLVVMVNEGRWRTTKRIHLKTPVPHSPAYIAFRDERLNVHGASFVGDEATFALQHANTMAFNLPAMQPYVQNRALLAVGALAADPNFGRVDPAGADHGLAGVGLGVEWYACKTSPRIIAALPGRPANGLTMAEAFGCIRAMWGSQLCAALAHVAGGPTTLCWTFVPCFAQAGDAAVAG